MMRWLSRVDEQASFPGDDVQKNRLICQDDGMGEQLTVVLGSSIFSGSCRQPLYMLISRLWSKCVEYLKQQRILANLIFTEF